MSLQDVKDKPLKLWNGRLSGYERGYIAAYSRADAVRIAGQMFGPRGWQGEIRDYWNKGLWGNQMIGVTPRRGMFAQKKDGSLVEIVGKGKTIPLERDDPAAWEQFQSKQKAATEAAEREREQARLERDQRLGDLADFLEGLTETGFIVQPQDGYVELWRNGFKYRIEEVTAHREE